MALISAIWCEPVKELRMEEIREKIYEGLDVKSLIDVQKFL